MGRGRPLSIEDAKAVVSCKVLDPEMSYSAMERVVGRDAQTCKKLANRYTALIAEYRVLKQGDIIDELDLVRRAHLANVADPTKIEACSALQSATVYGILTYKLLLQSGLPTAINLTATVDATMPDLLAKLKRAIEAAGATRSRRSGQKEAIEADVVRQEVG